MGQAAKSSLMLQVRRAGNELRIDAAEMDKVKTEGECAAASIRVELSRTPEGTNQLEIKTQVYAGITRPSRQSSNQQDNCTWKRNLFANEWDKKQAVGEEAGIRTERQLGSNYRGGWVQAGSRQSVHGERHKVGARECWKSIGWAQ